ncbi:MFS transporter [candidate division KSB1 bacterium]|nr:MFS transporter [candidate division KSB1 bacterium]NIR70082.1 MFS transporter [candidate division KSB1 bacterium]NIS24432.1 MFS transporter [candidate division KSB1 bacterium]NIT71368.1 MFS transporter [candidate division KSB1 bacterium]NIU25047.1 MFS transporter [candidate division KSB1 bacterium]
MYRESHTQTKHSTKVSPENEKWVLVSTILASSMTFIDYSALNVALPALQRDLGITGAELLWVVNAYALFLSALLLVGGSLGDLYGRKRIFILGIAIFTVASLVCGLAGTPGVLIGSRAIQGIGGALMVPGSLSIIFALFPDNKRGKAIGMWSTFSALTTVLGPVLGGWLAGAGLWRFIFFINLPLAAIALAALIRKVPENKDVNARNLDIKGAALATIGLAGVTYGFIQAPELGWRDGRIILSLAVGIITLAAFVFVEACSNHPMMALRLFKSRTFSSANAQTLLVYAALSGMLFFFPLNLVQVQNYSEQSAGLAILPFALLIAGLSRWAGGLVDRLGSRLPLIVGPALSGFGFFVLTLPGVTNGPQEYWITYFPGAILLGIGMGITVAPLTTAVMGAVPEHSSGMASGINNTIARTAGVFAIAVMGAVALVSFKDSLETGAMNLALSKQTRTELQSEASKLAEAQPPDHLNARKKAQIKLAIKEAFVSTFKKIGWIAAGLSWSSVLLAVLFVEKRVTSG